MLSRELTREQFWDIADGAKARTEAMAAEKMRCLETVSVDTLRRICIQYRFFTIYYIRDLALLLTKLPFGRLRSLLAQILSEELGEGDPKKAHPEVYDRFLSSIGVSRAAMREELSSNRHILSNLTADLSTCSPAFGVGLRGMGGECLCQTYLLVMFRHLVKHPYIRANRDDIDWQFWNIHTGEEDDVHVELTRSAIDEMIREDATIASALAAGYTNSITAWNQFWQNIFDAYLTN